MHRIWRVSGWGTLSSLPRPSTASKSMRTTCLATAAHRSSSTVPRRGKNTEWIRGKLWKGAPPGPDDPYRQREEQEEVSSLPDEATSKRLRRETTPAAVLASGLKLPPRRSEALTEQALQAADPTYAPATEAEGLEEILPAKMWWDQDGHWGPESEFNAFGRAEKAADKEVIEVCLRRAVVEVLALQESGSFAEWASKKWREGRRSDMDQALAMEIRVKDGNASLEDGATSVVDALTAEAEDTAASEMPTREEAKAFIQAWDPSWKEIRLEDEAKFAVRKRLYQLTGHLIPDAKLGASRTVKHILTVAAGRPRGQKLAQVLEEGGKLRSLENVKVHHGKLDLVDKETALGRWKVIEEELRKRGLPVTGTAGLPKFKEREWLLGKI